MPKATVASRELKNKDTGLDLFVPTYKEVKGRLSSTVFYQVVVVTNLPFFKTPSHKETDVVQLSLEKKWVDFEEMRKRVSESFTGTMVPFIDKKSFIVNDSVLRERRNSLDGFMRFLASVSKLAKSAPLLQFLGVDALRANKATLDDVPNDKKSTEAKDTENKEPEPEADVDVFGESQDPQDAADLFDDDEAEEPTFGVENEEGTRSRGSFSMFEAQDMKADIDEDDEKEFNFIPDAIITKREKIVIDTGEDDEEDKEKEELFKIEDDLDNLLVVDIEKPKKKEAARQESTEDDKLAKPSPAAKPKPPSKPSVPSKPKTGAASSSKPAVPPNKPSAASAQDGGQSTSAAVEVMQQDDLLAYLQEELSANTEEVDLFS